MLFLNDDVLVSERRCDALVAALDGATGRGRGRGPAGRSGRRTNAGRVPAAAVPHARVARRRRSRGRARSSERLLDDVETVAVDQPPGACLLVRRRGVRRRRRLGRGLRVLVRGRRPRATAAGSRGGALRPGGAVRPRRRPERRAAQPRAGRLAPLPRRAPVRGASISGRRRESARACSTRWSAPLACRSRGTPTRDVPTAACCATGSARRRAGRCDVGELDRARGSPGASPFRRILTSRRVEPLVAAVLRASPVRERVRFLAREAPPSGRAAAVPACARVGAVGLRPSRHPRRCRPR